MTVYRATMRYEDAAERLRRADVALSIDASDTARTELRSARAEYRRTKVELLALRLSDRIGLSVIQKQLAYAS